MAESLESLRLRLWKLMSVPNPSLAQKQQIKDLEVAIADKVITKEESLTTTGNDTLSSILTKLGFQATASLQTTGNTLLSSIYGRQDTGNILLSNIYGQQTNMYNRMLNWPPVSSALITTSFSNAVFTTLMTAVEAYLAGSSNQYVNTQYFTEATGPTYYAVVTEYPA